jgi:hypothetical protein
MEMQSKAYEAISRVSLPDIFPLLNFLNRRGIIIPGLAADAYFQHYLRNSGRQLVIQPTAFVTSAPWSLEIVSRDAVNIVGPDSSVEIKQQSEGATYKAVFSDEFGQAVLEICSPSPTDSPIAIKLIYRAHRQHKKGESLWVLGKLLRVLGLKTSLERVEPSPCRNGLENNRRQMIVELSEYIGADLAKMSSAQLQIYIEESFPWFRAGNKVCDPQALESYLINFQFARVGTSLDFVLHTSPKLQMVTNTTREHFSPHGLSFIRSVIGEPSADWLVNTEGSIRQHALTDDQCRILKDGLHHWGPTAVSLEGYAQTVKPLLVGVQMSEIVGSIREKQWTESSLVSREI